ncbi:tRNA splicing endonuclease-like protein subunit, partial [Byssothecium circinans]
MADEDEDVPNLQAQDAEDVEDDEGSKEYLRTLSKLAGTSHDTSSLTLPKRGEKDFESHSTQLQLSTLEASRAAMHSVLSWQRTHNPKAHVLAAYHEASNMACVDKVRSSQFLTVGRSRGGKEWLLPEEALFMIERGTLDCRWPVYQSEQEDVEEGGKMEETKNGAPMSLQGAYAAFLGFEEGVGGKLTMEMWIVYAGLKRAGYVVFRHGDWDDDRAELQPLKPTASSKEDQQPRLISRFFTEIWRRISQPTYAVQPENLAFGPLIKPGLYRSYADIFRLLNLIPTYDHAAAPQFTLPSDPTNPYRIHFDVWKTAGSQRFRKANRRPPDFRVCVINARETPIPTAAQLNDLLATVADDPPPTTSTNIFQNLKYGKRNVILAIVDNGIPSYITVADAPFVGEKVYDRGVRGGRGKGGARGRGGRGRGRGR